MSESKLREAIVEYLRAEGSLNDEQMLVHFAVIGVGVQMDDPESHFTLFDPSKGFPFAYQLGALDYCITMHRAGVVRDRDEDDN
jgi:hypothetical protein